METIEIFLITIELYLKVFSLDEWILLDIHSLNGDMSFEVFIDWITNYDRVMKYLKWSKKEMRQLVEF
jgi:uncharacterized membrane protein